MKPSYALVGCGRIAPNHIQAALNNGLAVSALCDLDLSKARDLAARFGGGQGGGDRQGGRSIKGPGGKGKANDQGQDKKGIRHMPEGRGCQPAQ